MMAHARSTPWGGRSALVVLALALACAPALLAGCSVRHSSGGGRSGVALEVTAVNLYGRAVAIELDDGFGWVEIAYLEAGQTELLLLDIGFEGLQLRAVDDCCGTVIDIVPVFHGLYWEIW
ncbi:MAG: hypothetical protein KatS3mg102_0935 [Planctomycetota bacterium]|nr:MAG: hypothetical protein KatS3mg102_0935 [Planctomycetota bacterium]